jgi:hypothetical protein
VVKWILTNSQVSVRHRARRVGLCGGVSSASLTSASVGSLDGLGTGSFSARNSLITSSNFIVKFQEVGLSKLHRQNNSPIAIQISF